MNKILCLIMLGYCVNGSVQAQEDIYSRSYIKSIMDRVNTWQYNHPHREHDDNWIRGTYYTGVMAVYQATGDKKYLQQCNAWGEQLQWRIPKLSPGQRASGVNILTCGQTWLESYMVEVDKRKIEPILSHFENPSVKNPVSEPLTWYFEGGRRYVDGLFTGPPALAMLYKITGQEKYLDWMDACFWDVYGELFDMEEGFFYRDVRFKPGFSGPYRESDVRPDSIPHEEARTTYVYQNTKNGKKVLWSRGNGWAVAALARILKYLPREHGNYERYKALYVTMATELIKRQQPDGYWYPNLDDPMDYPMKETSGTAFFTYGLTWGLNNGLLSRDEYLPAIEKAWAALVSAVTSEGKVQWGQMVAGGPYKILQDDSHEYVSGMFLLAASEVYQLKR